MYESLRHYETKHFTSYVRWYRTSYQRWHFGTTYTRKLVKFSDKQRATSCDSCESVKVQDDHIKIQEIQFLLLLEFRGILGIPAGGFQTQQGNPSRKLL